MNRQASTIVAILIAALAIYAAYYFVLGHGAQGTPRQANQPPITAGVNSTGILNSSSRTANQTNQTAIPYIYCIGDSGTGGENLSFYGRLSSTGITNWTMMRPYPVGEDDAGCATYGGYIYCVGTNTTQTGQEAYYAKISPKGVGPWMNTTNYPVPGWYTGCSAYNGYLYCVGDRWLGWNVTTTPYLSSTDLAVGPGQRSTYYAPISSSGIGAWKPTTQYPIPFFSAGCAIYNGYIYCVGDFNQTYGTRTYFAAVSSSGIGNWTQTTPFPENFSFSGCQIYYGRIYCEGGFSNLTYYANVSSSGIGNWIPTTPFPEQVLYEGGCDIYNGYVYCVGNRWNDSAGNQVFYANVLPGGGFGQWQPSAPFPLPIYGDSWCVTPGSGGGFLSGGGQLPNAA